MTETYLRPNSAASCAPNRASSVEFRPASALSVQTRSTLCSTNAARYTPTELQRAYDERPSIGIFRKQLLTNSWFLANQRAPSQLRRGKPLAKEMPLPTQVFHRSGSTAARRNDTLLLGRPATAASTTVARSPTPGLGSTRTSTASRLRSEVSRTRRAVFGEIEEDHESLVLSLSCWAPNLHEAKPESLPSHYRTTVQHGSTAHTIWDFVWEKPVLRSERIKQEIQMGREEWDLM